MAVSTFFGVKSAKFGNPGKPGNPPPENRENPGKSGGNPGEIRGSRGPGAQEAPKCRFLAPQDRVPPNKTKRNFL